MAIKRYDGTQWVDTVGISMPAGIINPYAGIVAPSGWLLCDGTAVSRTTYATLFNILVPNIGTVTITIASPGVVTLTNHGMITGDAIYLTTTGALPTGLTANTIYYVINVTSSTFRLATSRANALAGTAINTSGTQSGTHTAFRSPYGLGNGSTTFNVPDLRSKSIFGAGQGSGLTAYAAGQTGGAETQTLIEANLPPHQHTINHDHSGIGATNVWYNSGGAANIASGTSTNRATFAVNNTFNSGNGNGTSTAFSILNPYISTNFIIKV